MNRLLRDSILSTFSVYQKWGKSSYSFIFTYCLVFSIVGVVISYLICLAGNYMYGDQNNFFPIDDGIYVRKFIQCFSLVSALAAPLPVYYLHLKEKGAIYNLSIRETISMVKPPQLENLAVLSLIFVVAFLATYNGIIPASDNYDMFSSTFTIYGWFNGIVQFLVELFIYVFSAVFILSVIRRKNEGIEMLKKYKNAIYVVIIFSLITTGLIKHVDYILELYVFPLFYIPFRDSLAPSVLKLCVYLVSISYGYLLFASAIFYPMYHEAKFFNEAHDILESEEEIISDRILDTNT